MEPKDEQRNEVLDVCQVPFTDNHEYLELEPSIEQPLPSALEEKINCPLEVALSSYLVDDSIHIDKGIQNVIGQDSEVRESHKCELDVNELAKLPQEVFDENPEVQELENYRPTETGKDAALQGGLVYSQTAVDTSSPDITQVKQQPQEALEEGLVPAAMVD
ncbi:unnamed protein product [Ilex paraguariensis]|uniref:Uncharacterized protein n=1 Tax=Ilex paraguariensis TaxID=185542 RepID=A0ABC8T8W3_9AQUA